MGTIDKAMKGIMFNEHFGLESAVLSGRKTQTRRLVKCNVNCNQVVIGENGAPYSAKKICGELTLFDVIKQNYRINEVVAIKQCYKSIFDNLSSNAAYDKECFIRDVGNAHNCKEVSDVFNLAGSTNKMFVKASLMPRHIKITNIRVEMLQDISEEDCLREGLKKNKAGGYYYTNATGIDPNPKVAFASLIDKISGKGTWESKPYVWVYDFELLTKTE